MKIVMEAYNARSWGGQRKASNARNARARLFEEHGYEVFTRTKQALNRDFNSYEFVAIENDRNMRPVHPDTKELIQP